MDIYYVIAYSLIFAEIVVFAVVRMRAISDNQYIETASKMLEDYSDAESVSEKDVKWRAYSLYAQDRFDDYY